MTAPRGRGPHGDARRRAPLSLAGNAPRGDRAAGARGAVSRAGAARRWLRDTLGRIGLTKEGMYRGGRPNRVAALLNRGWAIIGSAGLGPNRLVTLEVRGRRSGRRFSFPLMVADHEGERYVVAMLGERARWVSNVRAARGRAILRHGRRAPVRLEEVDPSARAPILRRYLQIAPGARAHIPVDRRAPLEEFERIAERYPVFRVRADPGPPEARSSAAEAR